MSTKDSEMPSIWALLIGIDVYKTQPNLRGCVNDVTAVRALLMNRYGISEEQIRVITNEEATRDNIIKQFKEFLINNENIRKGDQILFHYSGHGSQMPAGPDDFEPDGLNETIVPSDSRTPGVYDIPDKTIAAMLEALAEEKGNRLTIILDSCHSGSATRGSGDPKQPEVRRVPADVRIPPIGLDEDLRRSKKQARRSTSVSGWDVPEAPYVLLAGCRDQEASNEYASRVDGGEIFHGALTFFLLQVLTQLPHDATYGDLHERVAALVNANFPSQTPQCEGERNRRIFGTVRVQSDPFLTVKEIHYNLATLGAGLVHGLRIGTRLALFPPEVRSSQNLPEPIAIVAVTSVGAATAQAEVVGTAAGPIPQFARALITSQVYEGLRQTIDLEAAGGINEERAIEALRQRTLSSASDGGPSPYLQLAQSGAQDVDLRVKAEQGKYRIYNGNGELLVVPEDIGGQQTGTEGNAAVVCKALESIVRYRTVMNLSNVGQSRLQGKVKLRLRHYTANGPVALAPEAIGPGGELTLYYNPDHENENSYVVDVINESGLPVYLSVFTLSPDYSISLLYPTLGQQEAIHPTTTDHPYPIGLQSGTQRLKIWLPPGWDASQDYLKAIVTTQPVDLRTLEQKGFDVPPPYRGLKGGSAPLLNELVDAVAFGSGTRFAGPDRSTIEDDWAVIEIALKTVRKFETTVLDSEMEKVQLSEELTLVKKKGISGKITVTTFGLGTRGALGDPGLKPPPALANFPDVFQSIQSQSRRGIGDSGLVLALELDDESRKQITPQSPLRLEMAGSRQAGVTDLLPIAFDGEDYLLAGYGGDDGKSVNIVSLPAVASAGPAPAGTARGIGRTIRLFVYKKLGRYTSEIGLRKAELKEGRVAYSEVAPSDFKKGEKVALFVHGFLSDSRWMIEHPAQFLSQQVQRYDHLLTWDYETFGTSVETNGQQLASALRQQCGFAANDGIAVDVYAHSMGTLVSRCMIELGGGRDLVDRLVLAGPPNHGSTLATTGRGLIFLVTSLINHASVVPVVAAANWVTRQLYEAGVGLADLAVNSEIQKKLNALGQPSGLPYLVLAGNNVVDEREGERVNRIALKVLGRGLDTIFGEKNDLAVGLSSMKTLGSATSPSLKVEVLPCDHFHYFVVPEGQLAIQGWYKEHPRG